MRTREEIEKQDNYLTAGAVPSPEATAYLQRGLILEILLDIRDLLQKPSISWSHEVTGDTVAQNPPQRDPLFDKAEEKIGRFFASGESITPKWLKENLGITYARASAIYKELEDDGFIKNKKVV